MKLGLKKLDAISSDFEAIRDEYLSNKREDSDPAYTELIKTVLDFAEDSILLRRLILLGFKLHSYHLRLKHRNMLSVASSYLHSDTKVDLDCIRTNMGSLLEECNYVTQRFSNLQGIFNKIYVGNIRTPVSRTVFHMLDATFSECQAWKYVNSIYQYALLYQSGYESLASASNRIDKLYLLYTDLKQGDPHRMLKVGKEKVDPEHGKKLLLEAKDQVTLISERIKASKADICAEGASTDATHKNIMTKTYEILLDSSMLYIAYYDLFWSFHDSLSKNSKH